MRNLTAIFQGAALVGLGWLLVRSELRWWAADEAAATTATQAATARARAATLEGSDQFAAAAFAWREAASLRPGPEGWLAERGARRAEALAAVAGARLPAAAERPRLWALEAALTSDVDAPESLALAKVLRLALLRAEGRRAEAALLVNESVAAGETSPWFQWHAGALRLEEGRVDEARELLEALARQRPGFGPGLHRLGLVYVAADRLDAAVETLGKAVTAGAEAEAELDLGRLFMKREMWAEGLPHLENALRAGAGVEAVRLVAAAHFHLKRYDLAAQTYRRAHALEPDARTLLSAAIALTAGGRHAEAQQALESLLPQAAEVPEVLYQLAVVQSAQGASAREALARYVALARGRAGEAERVAKAEAALTGVAEPGPTPAGLPIPPQAPPPTPRAPRPHR